MSAKSNVSKPAEKSKYKPLNVVDEEWKIEDSALFDFGIEHIDIPSIAIVQPTSRMPEKDSHIGQIYNTVTQQFWPRVELVFIGWNTPRAIFPYPFSLTAKQLCASPDSRFPFPKYVGQHITAQYESKRNGKASVNSLEGNIPESCDRCQFAEGGFCVVMYRYFGIQIETGRTFTMRFKKTGLPAARRLNFWLNDNQQNNLFTTFYMSAEKQDTYYVPRFERGNDASAMFSTAAELNRALNDRIRRAAQAQLTDVTGDEGE